jgi:hypothetical protein
VQDLEGDVLNGLLRYHEMTAILDKVAAGELLGRRQDMAANQLLSHALEQLLARGKRQRDTEASTMNMQLVTWRDGAPSTMRWSSAPATRSARGGSRRRSRARSSDPRLRVSASAAPATRSSSSTTRP